MAWVSVVARRAKRCSATEALNAFIETSFLTIGRRACLAGLTLPIVGCAALPARPPSWQELPGWQSERVSAALSAITAVYDPKSPFRRAAQSLTVGDETAARLFIERAFLPIAPQRMLYTGYFTITLQGATRPSPEFPVPILRTTQDAARFDRRAILAGALAGRGLELAWLRDAADLYFLQLQGSGRIILEGGDTLNVVSFGSNRRPPIATERLFANAGLADNDLSITNLRAWIAANPRAGQHRLELDPSYVFFQEGPARGASGALLLPLRSMAVDPRYISLGRPLWVKAGPLQGIMVASDTGSPISGPNRADIFFGAGPAAEEQGGRLYETGIAWQLAPTGWFS
jgi:membrane-bound lytic murein transglycosylase A